MQVWCVKGLPYVVDLYKNNIQAVMRTQTAQKGSFASSQSMLVDVEKIDY